MYEIIKKDKYIYLKLYKFNGYSELSEFISVINKLCSSKEKNILVDIRECEKFNELICIFYETIKTTQVSRVAFFVEEYYDHINFSRLMKILSEMKLSKTDIFINKNELKKWIGNLSSIQN